MVNGRLLVVSRDSDLPFTIHHLPFTYRGIP
jgi:hypothetical protein